MIRKQSVYFLKFTFYDRMETTHRNIINKSYLKTWKEIQKCYSNFSITEQGGSMNFTFDWEPIVRRFEMFLDSPTVEEYIYATNQEQMNQLIKDLDQDVIVTCKISKEFSRSQKVPLEIGSLYLTTFLYKLFWVSNLSSPGCYSCKISFKYDAGKLKKTIDFKNIFMELAWLEYINEGWPEIFHISVNETRQWIESLKIDYCQVAKTRTEKVLFALLHVSLTDPDNPFNIIIWLAHALEALFDSPRALISETLRNRIFMVLKVPEEIQKRCKKKLNIFYNLRSRFVHGEFDILHPALSENFDSSVSDIYLELISEIHFILAILLSTIQKMVLNNWKTISFNETYKGD